MDNAYDDQRKFQRIPAQRVRQAKDRAERVLNQATCIRIPKNVVLEARERVDEDSNSNPLTAVRNFVSSLLR